MTEELNSTGAAHASTRLVHAFHSFLFTTAITTTDNHIANAELNMNISLRHEVELYFRIWHSRRIIMSLKKQQARVACAPPKSVRCIRIIEALT